ncbi:MAG: glycosyltransferase [Promethearchaeota archaeon]
MRILHVTPYYYPAEVYGGPVQCVYHIASEQARLGHEVTVYTSNALDRNKLLSKETVTKILNGVKVYYFHNVLRGGNVFFTPEIFRTAKKEIKNFDIIHLHEYRTIQNVAVAWYAKKYGVNYCLEGHGTIRPFVKYEKLKKIFDFIIGRKILKNSSGFIAITNKEVEDYKEMNIKREKITIIPNGIDLSEFKKSRGDLRDELGIKKDEIVILFLGRIAKIKGLDFLIRTIKNVKDENFKLLIAGPDEQGEKRRIKDIIKQEGIENKVIWVGSVFDETKQKLFRTANLFVLPSIQDTFPITLLEAWMHNLPIICTKSCSLASIIQKENVGIIVNYGDIKQFSKKLTMLINNKKLRDELGRKGKRLVLKKYTWQKIIPQIVTYYSALQK